MTIHAYRSAFSERTKTLLKLSLGTALACSAFTVNAEEENINREQSQAQNIDTIIVSATRQSSPLNRIAGGVTVLTTEDIEKSHATSLVELISTTPGLNIVQSGTLGSQASLFVRGSESNHTGILINGQKQKASLGGAPLQNIDLNQIERIEILRGPQATLHGSDTIGGVINIITKQNGDSSNLTIAAGSNNYQNFSASTLGAKHAISIGRTSTEGINSTTGDLANDRDGFTLESASASFQFDTNANFSHALKLSGQQGVLDYDSAFSPTPIEPREEFRNHNIGLENKLTLTDDWNANFNLGQSRNKSQQFNDGFSVPGNFSTLTHNVVTLNTTAKLNNVITISGGLDFADDTWEQETGFKESIDNLAAFTLGQYEDGINLINLSARHDDNDQYGSHSTYAASYQLILTELFTPYISVSNGFKAPDFSESVGLFFPNPDLNPETSENREIGFRSQSLIGNLSASIFQNDINDFIQFLSDGNQGGTLENIGEVEIEGIEIAHQLSIAAFTINSNVSYIRAFDSVNNTELLRRPRRLANLQLDYQVNSRLRFGIAGHGESSRLDFGSVILPGFALLNTQLAYELNDSTQVSIKANNILDKEYQVQNGFLMDKANFIASIKTTF